jgi:hypothetical protein
MRVVNGLLAKVFSFLPWRSYLNNLNFKNTRPIIYLAEK